MELPFLVRTQQFHLFQLTAGKKGGKRSNVTSSSPLILLVAALMGSAAVYAYAKDRPGPIIRTVEEAVKSVVAPVYQKFHLLPDELLRHAHRLHDHSGAAVHGAPAASRNSAPDIARSVCSKCEPAANVLYERYESKAAAAWRGLNRVPLLPRAAEKCNEAVMAAAEKSHRVSSRLNVVPVKRIAKVFGEKQ